MHCQYLCRKIRHDFKNDLTLKILADTCSESDNRHGNKVSYWQQATVTTCLKPSDANYSIIAISKYSVLSMSSTPLCLWQIRHDTSMKFKQPSRGTKAVIFFPFLMSCTRTHLRMAEFGCFASTPLQNSQKGENFATPERVPYRSTLLGL